MSKETTPATTPAKPQVNITESVLARVNQFQALGELRIPENYSPENALKSAYLILTDMVDSQNRPVLQSCTQESIANALLNMVVQGLSPMKKQGAFIAYNGKLSWQTEYHGNIALAKRYGGVKEVSANVIYEGDTFEYTINPKNGRKIIVRHEQNFENIDNNKLKGAYATLILDDDSVFVEIMNMHQIRLSWAQGAAKGNSPAHRNFPDEMAKKTVISRACKLFISTSDDSSIIPDEEPQTEDIQAEVVSTKANKQVISMTTADDAPEYKTTPPAPAPAPVEEPQETPETPASTDPTPKMDF